MSTDHLTLEEILEKLDQDGFLIHQMHQRASIGQGRWSVAVYRATHPNEDFQGAGPTFRDALVQAAGNAGAITGRRSMIEQDRPKKRKPRADLLA